MFVHSENYNIIVTPKVVGSLVVDTLQGLCPWSLSFGCIGVEVWGTETELQEREAPSQNVDRKKKKLELKMTDRPLGEFRYKSKDIPGLHFNREIIHLVTALRDQSKRVS